MSYDSLRFNNFAMIYACGSPKPHMRLILLTSTLDRKRLSRHDGFTAFAVAVLGYFCPTPRKGKNRSSPNIRDTRGKIDPREWLNLAASGAHRAPLAIKSFVAISQK